MMNYNKIASDAECLHRNAKDGVAIVGGERFLLKFKRPENIYEVVDSSGEIVTRLNTRKMTQARKWLREYLEN